MPTPVKPVLIINTKMKCENPDWQEIGETPAEIYLRPQIGIALEKDEIGRTAEAVSELLGKGAEYRDRIDAIKRSHLFSYGTNGAEGVKYILTRLSDMQKKRKENK